MINGSQCQSHLLIYDKSTREALQISATITEILVGQNEPFSDQKITVFFSDITDFQCDSH